MTYNGSAQVLVTPGSTTCGELQYAAGTDPNQAPAEGWSTSIPMGTDAGSYYVWYRVIGDSNHTDSDPQCVQVQISSGNAEEKDVYPNALKYTGEPQKLVTSGTAAGGEMQYALGADDQTPPTEGWSAEVPTGTEAGTYYVWYKVKGDKNHNDTEPAVVEVRILAPISAAVTFKVVNGSWNEGEGEAATADKTVTLTGYEGDKLTLTAEQIPAVGSRPDAGYKAGSWDAAPNTETAITGPTTYTYTYGKKEAITPTVSITGWTYGESANAPSVSGNTGNGTVTYTYAMKGSTAFSETVPAAAGEYTVKASIAETADYLAAAATADFTIAKAAAIMSAEPAAQTLTYNGSAQALASTGTTACGELQYAIGTDADQAPAEGWSTSIPTGTDAGTYYVWYRVIGDENHSDTDPEVITAGIGKAEITKVKLMRSIIRYTGEELTAEVADVKAGDLTVPAEAYAISGNHATDEGKYTVTVTAVKESNYTGTAAADFHIVKPGNKYVEISLPEDTFVYTGKEIRPAVNVIDVDSGEPLSAGLYTVSYSDNTKSGYGKVTVTCAEGCTLIGGGLTEVHTFTIQKAPLTVTVKDQTINEGDPIASGTDQVTAAGLLSGHSLKEISVTAGAGDTAGKVVAGEATIIDESNLDVTANYDVTYVPGKLTVHKAIHSTVTFKVVNGSWDEGEGEAATADKTVTLDGYEGDTLTLEADQIPAVGNKPDDTFKAGSWDVTPNTETAITGSTTYTYTYLPKGSISQTVTFKVVNGSWNEGEGNAAAADKTVTLTGNEGDTLKLTADQIPAVGSRPDDTFKAGSWDVTPDTETAITGPTTYTYTYAPEDSISQTVTFKVVNGSWNEGEGEAATADKTVTLTGKEGDTLTLTADQIPAVGNKPGAGYKAGSWNVVPSTETAITGPTTYTYTYAPEDSISQTVTFKVVNGSWNEGEGAAATEDKTVTLTGKEGDTLTLTADQIPAVGSRPDDTFKAGCWDVTPDTETAITGPTTYTYTYAPKDSISQTVTFKVVNGSWNEGEGAAATEDKTVTLTGKEGDTLTLTADQIPAVGNKPNEGYKAGSWDVTPNTETAITGPTTYIYTYAPVDVSNIYYFAVQGAGSEYTLGSGKNLTFILKRSANDSEAIEHFTGASVDGVQMKEDENYEKLSGSVILEVKSAFLETLPAGAHTLTAQFNDGNSVDVPFTVRERNVWKVTFDMNGHGTAPAPLDVEEGAKAVRPADPTAEGYIFGGWYTDKECSKEKAFDFDTVITSDITLYAKWTKNAAQQTQNTSNRNSSNTAAGSGGTAAGSSGSTGKAAGTTPATGDMNHVWIWILMMAASVTAAAILERLRRQE